MMLSTQRVEKPWGRSDLPAAFGASRDARIGEIWFADESSADLPVLIKWLFTSEKLSIQVHPSDAEAKTRGLDSGKEECWYIVDAEPGAVLGIGTKMPLSPEAVRAASLSGDIENLIDWKPVKTGDYYYIPAGTVHAIGAGITLVEVQQNADITYRLYDYGRPRPLHLDDGVAVSSAAPYADERCGSVATSKQLVNGPYFDLWVVDGNDADRPIPTGKRRWILPVRGTVQAGLQDVAVSQCWLDCNGAQIAIPPGSIALIAVA